MSTARSSKNTRERTQLFANVRPYSPGPSGGLRQPAADPANPYATSGDPQLNAMYDHLESQHDEQFTALSTKIGMLKDLTSKIGTEVKDGTSLLSQLEDRFDGARVTVRNTMTRMIRSADKSGVGWRSWLILFGIVIMCFWFVMFV